jgi:hypothetical protein
MALGLVTVAGCNSIPFPSIPTTPDWLANRAYVVDTVTAGRSNMELPRSNDSDGRTRLQFDAGVDNRIEVHGCNYWHVAPWSIEGDRLVVGSDFDSTLLACGTADQWLRDFLRSQPEIADIGDSVTLTSGDTVMSLVLENEL